MTSPQRIIIGMSGASGAIYAVRALKILSEIKVERHLVMTKAAEMTLGLETDHTVADLRALADQVYKIGDIGAAIASGSFKTLGMLVVPCSVKSLSEIAYGDTSNLLTRAADVTLKERRRLVMMVRETPFHLGHLRAMIQVTEMGGIIAPPLPSFYARPNTLMEAVDQSLGRVLDLFDLSWDGVKRWGEDLDGGRRNAQGGPMREA
ncbi:MAG: UbiX family flavin prenyltransferase [Maricaulaceae bacterium]